MPGILFSLPKVIAWDQGVAQAGATLTFSQTGTSTPQNVYTDEALSVAHSNPVTADAEGVFAPIYLDPSLSDYRVVFKDSSGSTIYTVDDVPASIGATKNLTTEDTAPYILLKETDATANEGNWRIIATGDQLLIQSANDALDTFATFITVDRSATTISDVQIDSAAWTINAAPTITGNTVINGTLQVSSTFDLNGSLDLDGGTFGANLTSAATLDAGGNLSLLSDLVANIRGTTGTWVSGATVKFPDITTTGSAANAFLDSGDDNRLYRSTSSIKYKTEVHDLTDYLSLLELRPVRYKSKIKTDGDREFVGLIAEEVAKVDPRLVHFVGEEPDGVMYDRLTVGLLALVKELREELDQLKAAVYG